MIDSAASNVLKNLSWANIKVLLRPAATPSLAAILAEKGRANWTADDLAAWDAGKAIWDQIAAIRLRSDTIEAMDPIPADFADDQHWA